LSCSSPPARAQAAELKEVPVSQALARRFPEEVLLITFQKGDEPGITVIGNNHVPDATVALKKGSPAHRVVSETGEFVLSFPGEDMETEVLNCFAHNGAMGDAFSDLGLATSPGTKVNAPLLQKCLANYECRVTQAVDAGDSTVFKVQIVAAHWTESRARRLYLAGYAEGKPVLKGFECARKPPLPPWFEKYPEQIVMIVSCDGDGKPNVMTAGGTMRVSDDPPMLAIMISKGAYTHGLIRASKQFVYGYPGEDMEYEMLYCGTHTGGEVDKFKEARLATQPAKKVRPPLLQKWLAAFECTVVGETDYGGHTIFIGRIEAAYVSDKQVPRIYNLGADTDGKRVFKGLEGIKE
jgi:flavin reductase (DIM6/NTAB) family NADH-FMN oxidoreductase RutF